MSGRENVSLATLEVTSEGIAAIEQFLQVLGVGSTRLRSLGGHPVGPVAGNGPARVGFFGLPLLRAKRPLGGLILP